MLALQCLMESDFTNVAERVARYQNQVGSRSNSSELHGLLTGWLCAGSEWSEPDQSGLLDDWFDADSPDSDLVQVINDLASRTLDSLKDMEFGFRLMLPHDDDDNSWRQHCISTWCTGFLAGFGATGRFQDADLSEEVTEVLDDLARIAALDDQEIPDDEENEADLMEIAEYVRISVVLVYTECATGEIH